MLTRINVHVCCCLWKCVSCIVAPCPGFDLSLPKRFQTNRPSLLANAGLAKPSWAVLCGCHLHTAAFYLFFFQPHFHTSSQLPTLSARPHLRQCHNPCLALVLSPCFCKNLMLIFFFFIWSWIIPGHWWATDLKASVMSSLWADSWSGLAEWLWTQRLWKMTVNHWIIFLLWCDLAGDQIANYYWRELACSSLEERLACLFFPLRLRTDISGYFVMSVGWKTFWVFFHLKV